MLDCLSAGWASAATSLDWAIKLALYKEEACRRGCGWEVVATWTTVASQLTAALARAGQRNRPLTAQLVLDRYSLIAADVARLASTVLRKHGLGWSGFPAFLDLRNRLFVIRQLFGHEPQMLRRHVGKRAAANGWPAGKVLRQIKIQ